jgi:hypothetical protein
MGANQSMIQIEVAEICRMFETIALDIGVPTGL